MNFLVLISIVLVWCIFAALAVVWQLDRIADILSRMDRREHYRDEAFK